RGSDTEDCEDLRAFVQPRYLEREGFSARKVDQGGLVGLLVSGTSAPGPADWCDVLSTLSGHTVEEENRTACGLLLIRTEKAVYALTYGMGHLLINQARTDTEFGIECAIRCLLQTQINRVRRHPPIPTEKAGYALTYGMGHLLINQARIGPGFGIEFAIRCLNESRITRVRRQLMDARGRSDENSATSGEHIRSFGIEQFGEIV